jgi:hypothetical protein
MGRPSMGRHARTTPVTVKVTADEAAALRRYGSASKGLRALIDRHLGVSDLTRIPVERSGGRCRIHKTWSDPVETFEGGNKTVSKVCQDCGYVSTAVRPA